MIGGLFDDVIAGLLLHPPKQQVVLAEVGVAQHVGGDQDVLGFPVGVRQIGMPRIAGDHHLEDMGMAHAVLDQLIDVAHPERPVRHAHRQAIDRHFHHEAGRHLFELHRKIVQAIGLGEGFDFDLIAQGTITHGAHLPQAAWEWTPKKVRIASQMSSSWVREKRAPCCGSGMASSKTREVSR